MKEILYETNLENYYKELDIDVQMFKGQRLMYSVVFAVLGALITGAFVFIMGIKSIFLGLVIVPFMGFLGYKWLYFQLKTMSIANKQKLDMLFPEFLTTFISLLNSQANGNVINAIENTIPYMKEPIKTHLIMLVRRIYEDSSVDNAYYAFSEFSKAVDNKESEQILSLLLDMYISGINEDTLSELETRIEKMKQNQISAYAKWKNGRLRNKAALPSLGIATLFIFAWIGVVAYHYLMTGLSGTGL